jgi:hypothetical protein
MRRRHGIEVVNGYGTNKNGIDVQVDLI